MDHDQAVAISLANLRSRRAKDVVKTAQALGYLRSLPEYPNNKSVGAVVGVSGEMVREFLSILDLPSDILALIHTEGMTLEHGRRLSQLARRRPEILHEVARTIARLSAIEARQLTEYLLRHPEVSVEAARSRILEARRVTVKEFHVIAVLDEQEYKALRRLASKQSVSTSELVTDLLRQSLRKEGAHG